MSQICNLNPQEFISYSNNFSTTPALLIFFIFTALVTLVVGLLSVEKSREKFMKIWFISFSLSAVMLIVIIYLPNTVQGIANLLR
jgi:phosphate starvation-inducible membrane PsiE